MAIAPRRRCLRTIGRAAVRFVFRELPLWPVVGRYRPRNSQVDVFLRHRVDRYILNEIFGLRLYDLPADAKATLVDLGRPPVGLDLGAHVGLFGAFFFSLFPDGDLVAFELTHRTPLLGRCIGADSACPAGGR